MVLLSNIASQVSQEFHTTAQNIGNSSILGRAISYNNKHHYQHHSYFPSNLITEAKSVQISISFQRSPIDHQDDFKHTRKHFQSHTTQHQDCISRDLQICTDSPPLSPKIKMYISKQARGFPFHSSLASKPNHILAAGYAASVCLRQLDLKSKEEDCDFTWWIFLECCILISILCIITNNIHTFNFRHLPTSSLWCT